MSEEGLGREAEHLYNEQKHREKVREAYTILKKDGFEITAPPGKDLNYVVYNADVIDREATKPFVDRNLDLLTTQAKAEAEAAGHEITLPETPSPDQQ